MNRCECDIHQVIVEVSDPAAFLETIRLIGTRWGTHLIFFNADLMAGKAHALSALFHAFRANEEGCMISSRVEMEALLYAAGSRQCQTGMRFGLHEGKNEAYLCIGPPSSGAFDEVLPMVTVSTEDWDSISPEKAELLAEIFGITPDEIEAAGPDRLVELVLERVALLEVYK
jgi:KEOPS complex subunit Cgi121